MNDRSVSTTGSYKRTCIQCRLDLTYFFMTAMSGVLANSLTLLADAAHWLAIAGVLGVSIFGHWIRHVPDAQLRYWYRAFVAMVVVHVALLLSITFVVFYEALHRFQQPQPIADIPMLFLGVAALGIKWHYRAKHCVYSKSTTLYGRLLSNPNITILGSIAVVAAAMTSQFTGWSNADSLFGVGSAILLLPQAWLLISDSTSLVVGAFDDAIDPMRVKRALLKIDEVVQVYDLRVRNGSSARGAVSAHLVLRNQVLQRDAFEVVEHASAILRDQFQIAHSTFHIEHDDDDGTT